MCQTPRIPNGVVLALGLLAAGMAGQTRFRGGHAPGPVWLDLLLLLAIGVVLVGLGRSFAAAASRMVDEQTDAEDGGSVARTPGRRARLLRRGRRGSGVGPASGRKK